MDSFIFSRVGRKIASLLLAGLIVASTVPAMPVFADNENEALPNVNATEATQQKVTDKPTAPTAPTEPPTASTVPTAQPVPVPTTPIVTPVPGPTGSAVNPNKPTEAPTEPPTKQTTVKIETSEGKVDVELIYLTDSAYVNGENVYVREGAKLSLNLNGNSQPYAAYLSGENNSKVDFENNELTVDKNLKEGSKYELFVKVSENADFIPVKGITIIADYKGPELSNIKYNGKEYDQADWSDASATIPVTFDVSDTTSGIAYVSVTPCENGKAINESGSEIIPKYKKYENGKYTYSYSYNVPAGKYNQLLFLAKDNVGNSAKNNDGGDGVLINLKRDVTAPSVTIPTEQQPSWSSVKFNVIDEQSGVSTVTAWAALEKATEKGATKVEYANESATSILTPEKDAADTYLYDVPQGNYDRVIIKAQDKMGNISTSQIVIGKDGNAPDINSITYEAAETPLDRILKFITFGIYSNNNIIVTVTAKDEQSGVDSISLYNGGESEATIPTKAPMETGEEGVASQKFELSSTDGNVEAFDLYVAAKDVAENETRKVSANTISSNVIGKASNDSAEATAATATAVIPTAPTRCNEVVVDKKAPEVETIAIEPTGFEEGTTVWHPGNITIKSRVNDEGAGIDTYTIKHSYNNTDATEKTTFDGTKPITSTEISTEISSLGSGEHKFQITAVDNAGNENSNGSEISLLIDADAPTVGDIEISPAKGVNNNGNWYSGNVVLKSTITDKGSGVASYNVYDSTDGENFNDLATEQKLNKAEATYETKGLAEGEHTIKITAKDNVGNEQSKTVTFYIDTKAPMISGIEISPAKGVNNNGNWYSGNVIINGDIENKDSGLKNYKVEYEYPNCNEKFEKTYTSIVDKVLFKTEDALGKDLSSNKYDGKHTITITAVDNVDNETKNEEVKTITFYIDTKAPEITKPTIKPENDNVKNSKDWYSGNVTVTTSITDYIDANEKNGAASNLSVDGKNPNGVTKITLDNDDNVLSLDCLKETLKNSGKWKLSISTSNIKLLNGKTLNLADGKHDGKHTITITAVDNVGNKTKNEKVKTITFYIDTKAPEITKPTINPENDNVKNSKNWYSGNVTVTTTITDYIGGDKELGVASGINNESVIATITNTTTKKSYEVSNKCITVAEANGVWTASLNTSNLTLKTGDKLNLADGKNDGKYTVTITAKDKVANTAESKEAEFYIDTKAPEITKPKITPEKDNVNRSGNWYSGNVNVETTITDYIGNNKNLGVASGLDDKSVTATITNISTENKYEITKDCITVAENNGVWTAKLNTSNLTLKTGDKLNLADGKNDGKYTVTITAKDKVANTGKSTKSEFYIDTTIPCNYSFRFTGANTNTSKKTPTQPSQVEEKSYGYYFNSATSVTVTMEDCLTNDGALSNPRNEKSQRDFGSGIKEITIWTVGVDGNTKVYGTFSPNSKKEVTITIPAKFKGKVYAYAVDNVGNSIKSKELKISGYSPYGLIAETQDQHNQSGENHAALSMASTKYRDKDGKSLYDHTNNLVGVAVRDTYAGIYEAEITLTYGGTTERFTSTVSNDGEISSKYDGRQNGYLSSFVWDRANKNSGDNLITQMEATIKNLPNLNDVRVQIKLTDRAGNTTTNAETFSVDTTQPEISVSWNQQGKEYYNADRVATVTIKERNFDTNRVNLVVTGGDCSNSGWAYSGGSGDDTAYTAQITFSEDADYTFDISCTDMANNENVVASGSQTSDRFTIDQTKPAISVTYDNNAVSNGNYYNKKRTATITVVEHNFNASASAFRLNITAKGADNKTEAKAPVISGWTNRGDVHTATISFKDDGSYSFTFNYTDLANNSASFSQQLFYIDKAAPKMSISGVEDEHAYNGSVEPEFKVSDPNCDKYYVVFTRIDIEGKNTKVTLPTSKDKKTATSADISYLISQVEDNDGIYKVEYYAKDKAGNETEKKSLVFSVNRFGSTFMYAKDQKELQQATIIDDESYVKNVTKDLIIQEVNVDALEVKTVSVHKDDELMSISEGTDYSVIVSGGKSNNKWVTNSYKFNKDLFADNGRYHIVILTQDDAKNKASNENVAKDRSRELPVKFVVDHSAPEVLITNLNFENAVNTGEEDAKEYVYGDGEGEKQLYSESSKKVIVTVKDPNLFQSIPARDDDSAMEKAIAKAKEQNRYQVYLGTSDNIDQDKQYLDYEITKIENDEVELTMTISATPDKAAQNLIVTANDVVGNKTIAKVTNFTLSATWLMMFFNNVPLVIVVFSVLGLIIVGVVLLVVKKKSKRKA